MFCKQSLFRSKAGVTGVVTGQASAQPLLCVHSNTMPREPGFALWRAHVLLQPQSGSPFVETTEPALLRVLESRTSVLSVMRAMSEASSI